MLQLLARAGAGLMSAGRAAGSGLAKAGRGLFQLAMRTAAQPDNTSDAILSRALGATAPTPHKESRVQRMLNLGWALDTWGNRFGSSYPRFAETIHITVHGRRTAHTYDLYILALGLLTATWRFGVNSSFNEAIKVTIDRTGKTVVLEFTASFQGLLTVVAAIGGQIGFNTKSPYALFHNTSWLRDDVTLPGDASNPTDSTSAQQRWDNMPTVIRRGGTAMTSANTAQEAADEGNYGAWGVTTKPWGTSPSFVTYKPAAGPAPDDGEIADDNWPELIHSILLDPCRGVFTGEDF